VPPDYDVERTSVEDLDFGLLKLGFRVGEGGLGAMKSVDELEETIHVLKGRYKVRIGDSIFYCDPGGFAYLPSKVPHAFLNLTDEPGEIIVVYTPGGGHKFYEEFGPISRSGPPDPKRLAPLFEKYGMTLLGSPLSADD